MGEADYPKCQTSTATPAEPGGLLTALEAIGDFYRRNKDVIEKRRRKMPTIDFNTGQNTRLLYSRAKLIDMIFFTEGEILTK